MCATRAPSGTCSSKAITVLLDRASIVLPKGLTATGVARASRDIRHLACAVGNDETLPAPEAICRLQMLVDSVAMSMIGLGGNLLPYVDTARKASSEFAYAFCRLCDKAHPDWLAAIEDVRGALNVLRIAASPVWPRNLAERLSVPDLLNYVFSAGPCFVASVQLLEEPALYAHAVACITTLVAAGAGGADVRVSAQFEKSEGGPFANADNALAVVPGAAAKAHDTLSAKPGDEESMSFGLGTGAVSAPASRCAVLLRVLNLGRSELTIHSCADDMSGANSSGLKLELASLISGDVYPVSFALNAALRSILLELISGVRSSGRVQDLCEGSNLVMFKKGQSLTVRAIGRLQAGIDVKLRQRELQSLAYLLA